MKLRMNLKKASAAGALVKQLLKGKATEQIKEFLRFHPGAEQDVFNAFAATLADLGREATALGAVSVAAVQDLFEVAFNPRKSSAPRRRGEPFFPDWAGICKGMEKMHLEIRAAMAAGRYAGLSAVMLEFFRQVATRGSDDPPTEADFLKTQGHCGVFAECLQTLAASDAIPLSEKREIVSVFEQCAQSRAFAHYGVFSIGGCLPCIVAEAFPPEEALAYVRDLRDRTEERYYKDRCTSAEAAILRRMGKADEAERIMTDNADNVSMLHEELHRLIRVEGDYMAALKLTDHVLATLSADETSLRCFVHECRLFIFEKLKKKDCIPAELRALFVYRGGVEEYRVRLKAHVPATEWPAFYEELIAETYRTCKRVNTDQLAEVYAAESDYDRLRELLLHDVFNWYTRLAHYAPLLPEQYHAPLLEKALKRQRHFAEHVSTRRDYFQLAEAMRKTRCLAGGKAAIADMAAELRVRYARRGALLQEIQDL